MNKILLYNEKGKLKEILPREEDNNLNYSSMSSVFSKFEDTLVAHNWISTKTTDANGTITFHFFQNYMLDCAMLLWNYLIRQAVSY